MYTCMVINCVNTFMFQSIYLSRSHSLPVPNNCNNDENMVNKNDK